MRNMNNLKFISLTCFLCLPVLSFSQIIHDDIKALTDLAVTDMQVRDYIFTSELHGEKFAYVMPTNEVIRYISNYNEFRDSIAITESQTAPFVKTKFGQIYLIIDPFHSKIVDIQNSLHTSVIVVRKFKMNYHFAKLIFRTSTLSTKKVDSFSYLKVTCKARWDGNNWVLADVRVKNSSFINLTN